MDMTQKVGNTAQGALTETELYSVEISHIYLDQSFSNDQIKSIQHFNQMSEMWNQPITVALLLDDYNIKEVRTTPTQIFQELKKLSIEPDYYVLEKDLIKYADEFLNHIKVPKIKRQYETYIQKQRKYPCSLLTAIWYLLRLGYIADDKKIVNFLKPDHSFKPASKVVNFLPEYFSDVEKKCEKLIHASSFSKASHHIKNVFYPADDTTDITKKELL